MLAVAILIVLIATLICFYKGLKDKNYAAVSSGASTPTYLTNQIIEYLKQFDFNDSKTHQKPFIDKTKILTQKGA